MSDPSTKIALLTPQGRGALATIAVLGPAAHEIVRACVTPAIPRDGLHCPWLRSFRSREEAAEELVVAFTASDEARVHCHGGVAASEAVIAALVSRGAVQVTPQEWLHSQQGELSTKVARELLSQALTERTALILLDQAQGAWTREVEAIGNLLHEGQESEAKLRLGDLLARAPVGSHLTEPWKVVIAGRPNAGKSSLLNALLGFQRSITSPTPGTTRDVVTAVTAFAGWPVELQDTAGLRTSDDRLEALGIQRAEREIARADLVLLLTPADEKLVCEEVGDVKLLHVQSKADLGAKAREANEIAVSAVTGVGLEQLVQAIVSILVPQPPAPGSAVPVMPAQVESLRCALAAVERHDLSAAAIALGSR